MKADQRPGLHTFGRLYCAFMALLLIGLGVSAWSASRDNLYLGAMLCGVGVFMLAGLFGSITRVLALLGLSAAFALLSFAFSLGGLLLRGAAPGSGTLTVWAIELMAGGLATVLARSLYHEMTG